MKAASSGIDFENNVVSMYVYAGGVTYAANNDVAISLGSNIRAVQFSERPSILRMMARSRAASQRVFRTLSPPLARMML